MGLIKPQLTVIENSKLYLSRRPGFFVWFLLGLTISLFIEASRWFISNIFFLVTLLLGGIIFGLDIVGDWEDVILDRDQNIAIITKYIWSEQLFFNNTENSVFLNLSDIRHIGISQDMGLFFLVRDGTTVVFNVSGLSREEAQKMKRKITFFLNVSRMKNVEPFALDLHENLLTTLNYQDKLHFEKYYPSIKETWLCRYLQNNERLEICLNKCFSSPALGSLKNSEKIHKRDLTRTPCTDDSINQCHYSVVKHRSSVPKTMFVEKLFYKINSYFNNK